MKTTVKDGYKIVEYFHQSKTYPSKILWKVYESDGQLRAVFQTEEAALHFTRPLLPPTWI